MTLSALNESGKPVDWWFAYKLPYKAKPPKGEEGSPSTGFEYLYLDARSRSGLKLSTKTLDQESALHHTLGQIFSGSRPGKGAGWICYNDEKPEGYEGSDRSTDGHSKGVLAFDTEDDAAFWLLHSTPRFPDPKSPDFPDNEKRYGQTFLCVTLADVDTLRTVAEHMVHQQEPQVYDSRLPEALAADDPLRALTGPIDVSDPAPPRSDTFASKAGTEFRLFSKNRHWGGDFWTHLVGPGLGVDMDVETWRNGSPAVPPPKDPDGHHVVDILWINLDSIGVPFEWKYTKDHAKWGVSEEAHWVCVADINRQVSQEKRGGGAITFQHEELWKALSRIESLHR